MLKYREIDFKFADVWRVFISGSSSAGKTYFARELLKKNIFKYKRVYNYHPDLQEDFPVDWDDHLEKPVLYQPNLPTLDELLEIPHYSVVILDDLFSDACNDKNIDYLFRVLSSKRKLHVIIMTQRYFAEGPNALNIRNSSNYHVLMRNADARTNLRVGLTMNLKPEFLKANEVNKKTLYPYIFVDRTNQASVNEVQVFTDILSKYKRVIYKSMPSYIISEADFKAKFKILDKNTAVNGGNKKKIVRKRKQESTDSDRSESPECPRSPPPSREQSPARPGQSKTGFDKYIDRRRFERQVADAIQRHNVSTEL